MGRLDEIAVPNVEAALLFHNSVYHKILNILPQAKFIIEGANPSERIMSLAGKNVEVIPNYKKLEDVYPLADCVVLPLLSGGGVKGKLLEAAAFKKIIVSTTHGIEGTMFSDNVSVLLADSAEKFADACIEALTNSEKCATIIQNAYNILKDNYSWDSICNNYNEYLMSRVKN